MAMSDVGGESFQPVDWVQTLGENYGQNVTLSADRVAYVTPIAIDNSIYQIYLYPSDVRIICRCTCLHEHEIPIDPKSTQEVLLRALESLPESLPISLRNVERSLVLTGFLPRESPAQSRSIFAGVNEVLGRIHQSIRAELLARPPRVRYIFVGRFQPYHNGHHDVVCRLIRRDPSLFVDAADKNILKYPLDSLIIGVVYVKRSEKNPLDVGQRRQLIESAIASDPEIQPCRHLIRTESVEQDEKGIAHFASLKTNLPGPATPYFVSGNPESLAALKGLGFPHAAIQNRPDTGEQSGTKIRELIIQEKWDDLRKLLPAGVYETMAEYGMFQEIQKLAKGG
jgi:nicotinamide mononucleotide adenylyltransferase